MPLTRAAPWLVLLIGLLFTFAAHEAAERSAHERQQAEFSVRAQKVVEAVGEVLRDYERVLRGASGMLAASGQVSRDGFRAYVDSLDLDAHYRGFQVLGFAQAIRPSERGRHIDSVRAEGFPDYTIHPPGERESLSAIVFVEPFAGPTPKAFGYDMYSEPVRQAAMARARDTGEAAVSGKLVLLPDRDAEPRAGFLMYVPVYDEATPPPTQETRRATLRGWVFAPFRMHDLVQDLLIHELRDVGAHLRLQIYDDDGLGPDALIYDSARAGDEATLGEYAETDQSRYGHTETLSVGGHRWTMRLASLPAFEAHGPADTNRLFAAAGALLSVLLALVVHLLESANRRARRIAAQMTRELAESEARFRLMAESAPVMIWMCDADHACIWMNQRWRDFSGRSLAPSQRHVWREIIHPDDYSHAADAYFAVVDRREPFRTEFRVRRADGIYRWIINTGVPRFDADGAFAGYIGSCLDITERKQAERQLQEMTLRLERSAAEVHDLYQNAPCGYHSLDAHGNVTAINDTALRWLGYTREELLGKSAASFLTESSREAFVRRFPPTPDQHEYYVPDCEVLRKDGSVLPTSIRAMVLRDANGRFLGTRAVLHDMTEHRRVERERAEHARHVEALSRRLVAVQEEERRRLAANLYDWTSPNLATLKLLLNTVSRACEAGDTARIHGAIEDAQALLDDTTAGLREIGSELRPTVLDFAGLLPALDSYGHQLRLRTGIDIHIRATDLGRLPSETQTVLFRIAQEALANCVKHAGATTVELMFERCERGIRMMISDDGKGFDVAAQTEADQPGGFGLITMRERAEFIGARLSIHSSPGTGATIVVDIPEPPATPPTQIALALDLQDQ